MIDVAFETLMQAALLGAANWAAKNRRQWSHVGGPSREPTAARSVAGDFAAVLAVELVPLMTELATDPAPLAEREQRAAEIGAGVFQRRFAPSTKPEN